MVYATAARKTLGYLVISGVLALTLVTLLAGDLEPTAQVIADAQGGVDSGSWLVFALGICTGALMVGTYVHVAHLEAKR